MRAFILIFLFGLVTFQLAAQNNNDWGIPFKAYQAKSADKNYKTDWVFGDEKLYRVKIKQSNASIDKEIIVEEFKFGNLEKLNEKNLASSDAMESYHGVFQKEGVKYDVFASKFTNGHSVLTHRTLDIATGEQSEPTEVAKIKGKNYSNNGNFVINKSDNGMYYAIIQEQMFIKKTNEIIKVSLFNSDLKSVKTISHTYPHTAKRNPHHEVFVSNAGEVYFMKDMYIPKEKMFRTLFHWNQSDNKLVSHSLKMEKGKFIDLYQAQFDGEIFYIHGSYVDYTKVRLRANTGETSGPTVSGLFACKYDKGAQVYFKVNEEKDPLYNLKIKGVEIRDGKTWMLMDRSFVDAQRKEGTSFEYNYVYNYQGMYLAMIDNDKGTTDWLKLYESDLPKTTNDNGVYQSYAYCFNDDDELVIIYNKLEYNQKARIKVKVPHIRKFSATGSALEETVLNIPVGISSEEFKLCTDVVFLMRENTFLMHMKSRAESKLGRVKIE